jgi:type I restriction enzyme R subunit
LFFIRRNEANSAVYVEYQNRLDELIRRKQEEGEAIEAILNQLSELYSELDEIASLPERMGFPDKGSFEIFTLIKNKLGKSGKEELIKQFTLEVVEKVINRRIFIGWQDVPKEPERLQFQIGLFAADSKFQTLEIDDDAELMEQIMKSVIQNYRVD